MISLPPPSDANLPMLQEGSYVLKTFSKGVSRRPLEKMACSVLNRRGLGVFARHAHDLYRQIATVDGLALWRYNRGLMLSPNPDQPFENADFTNQYVERQRGLLASVTREHHPGAFSKTHLWHSHLTAKQGSFTYDGKGTPMVPNYGCPETVITMEQGLFFEELDYQAYKQHPKAIYYLMDGENADASQALCETELSLIQCYFDSCRIVVAKPGVALWKAIDEEKSIGQTWDANYKHAVCTFASLIGPSQMKVLVEAYQYYINPKLMRIGQDQLKAVSKMPSKYPWCKISIIVANIVTAQIKEDALTSMKRGTAVSDASVNMLRTIKSLGESTWCLIEESITKVMEHYVVTGLRGLDSHTALNLGCMCVSI